MRATEPRCACRKPTRAPGHPRRIVYQDIVSPWYVLAALLVLAGSVMAWVFLLGAGAVVLHLSEERLIPVLALFAWAGCWLMAGSCWKQGARRKGAR